ncbi:MAG TPA: ABC transporter permease subunit [Ruminiclostridium sp.]
MPKAEFVLYLGGVLKNDPLFYNNTMPNLNETTPKNELYLHTIIPPMYNKTWTDRNTNWKIVCCNTALYGLNFILGGEGSLVASFLKEWKKEFKKRWQLYVIILLPVLYVIIFNYIPMGGAILAFKDYNIREGIFGSPWAGFKYFNQFFHSPYFWVLIKNTLSLSFFFLIAGFPMPILLAIALNEVSNVRFKKTVQLVTYAPYFISTVVMVALVMQFLSPRTGIVNIAISALGGQEQNFMGKASFFSTIYVLSGIWQVTGYNAIIYIASLSSIDPSLYEAATVDGASRLQKIIHVDIPGILPTIIILLILEAGKLMSVGFEKVFLMQNDLNLINSEIISTYVYKIGLLNAQFSFSTAVGLFNSVVNFILILSVNKMAKRWGDISLW